ncbi:MutS-related protein [Dethiothermospora halolimnae]|uniref:MutS-related protein n=1 Tax=Dethiothermospora halolimnae TaxID=3114390 RepID=UPI003CCC43DD
MKDCNKIYEKRKNKYLQISKKVSKTMGLVSILRIIAIGISIAIIFLRDNGDYFSFILGSISIGIFIYLVILHNGLKVKYRYICNLKGINHLKIERSNGKWTQFKDDGEEFKNDKHSFSEDLDIFGQGSLFQLINKGRTSMGRKRLANILTTPCDTKEAIIKRQEAINELSSKRWWRDRLEVEGMMSIDKDINKKELINWINDRDKLYSNSLIIALINLMPLITISSIILNHFGKLSIYIPLALIGVQGLLLSINIGSRNRKFGLVSKYQDNLKGYKMILKHIERGNFKSEHLKELKGRLKDENMSAYNQMKRLEKIVQSTNNRRNMLFFPINIILLWDYRCLIKIERFKGQGGLKIGQWLEVIGEMEALSSLATLGYNNPKWSTPIIANEPSTIRIKEIFHPLLIDNPVSNDVTIKEPSRILLITGSNMSGKSTFLRTIGINLVLAYTGAKVCASTMVTSIMNIQTCMRTKDNMEKGVSSFYAELKRIEKIIVASQGTKQVFFLLDEILKGTNSFDRHTGAKMILKQLYNNNGMGLVSTHDLELGELEEETKGSIKNYHFEEYYNNNKIYFDYKLKNGISNTRNALYLLRMIGIGDTN